MLTSCLLHPTMATAVVTCSCRYADVMQWNILVTAMQLSMYLPHYRDYQVQLLILSSPNFIYTARTNYKYIKL